MSRAVYVYFFIGYLFILLQTSLLPVLLPFKLQPDLLLILIVYVGLLENFVRGSLLAFALGCLFDVFAGHYLGLHGFVLLVIFLLVRGTVNRFNTENSLLLLLMAFAGTFIQGGLLVFSLKFFAHAGSVAALILWRLLPQAMLNLLATWLLLTGCLLIQKRFFPRGSIPGLQKLR
ncbi:rod shape-determining protein MreD [Desulfuromonas sp. AOP6]|uniref:rod shape-determining protein MreD n=1 Tax=Desulfuromonas sp. AOP6 TaxID=1566351 RepID=UPI00126FED48|nr:rod shape-determining protein MreD [Desulfuromonas sp. AOP6]BCA80294.1 hypothetical protein AOP6_2081 [Desulfuromonas sp. AOP6]